MNKTVCCLFALAMSGCMGFNANDPAYFNITLDPGTAFQEITGFGASFTESSGYNFGLMSAEKKQEIINALFNPETGAGFTLTRTHINSCDYSISHYTYCDTEGDFDLKTFDMSRDDKYLIPLIKAAQAVKGADFKIISAPWSPPEWMKTNHNFIAGSLKADADETGTKPYYKTWALYFSKYLAEYAKRGIKIWAISPQNEPLHGGNWDTCVWSNRAEAEFISRYLGPRLEADGLINPADLDAGLKLFCFDHNKLELVSFAKPILDNPEAAKYIWGTAFHWYGMNQSYGVTDYSLDSLEAMHKIFPAKKLLHTESSIDIDRDNLEGQYWTEGRYGWPNIPFIPAPQYIRDIIGDLGSWSIGYIEWNMILSVTGGPNPYKNYNSAPVLVDPETGRVVYTPLYYILKHFSRFIRPGAVRIGLSSSLTSPDEKGVFSVSFKNRDGSIVLAVFNNNADYGSLKYRVTVGKATLEFKIDRNTLQTVIIRESDGVLEGTVIQTKEGENFKELGTFPFI
jgi:glucosylceramidase